MSQYRISLLLVAFCTVIFIFSGCDKKRFFEENRPIEKGVWLSGNKAEFNVPITDTLVTYNFYINVRNSNDYPYCNLFLFIQTTNPTGRQTRDTVECQLADYEGKWLGSGFSGIKFNRYLIQRGIRLKQKGTYLFKIEQAMRVKELKGIVDIGLRIEKENL